MKDYIKPTFVLAGLAPVALAVMNCTVKIKDENLLTVYEQLEIPSSDYGKTFLVSEDCVVGIPDGMTEVCKFTSTGDKEAVVFTS